MNSFLKRLRELSVERCEQCFFPLKEWTALEWAGAAAGECGEAANVAKKMRRGDDIPDLNQKLADEVADAVIYLDLLCAREGIDLEAAIVNKFNRVSDKVGFTTRLEE